jgi:hypothetical protein
MASMCCPFIPATHDAAETPRHVESFIHPTTSPLNHRDRKDIEGRACFTLSKGLVNSVELCVRCSPLPFTSALFLITEESKNWVFIHTIWSGMMPAESNWTDTSIAFYRLQAVLHTLTLFDFHNNLWCGDFHSTVQRGQRGSKGAHDLSSNMQVVCLVPEFAHCMISAALGLGFASNENTMS